MYPTCAFWGLILVRKFSPIWGRGSLNFSLSRTSQTKIDVKIFGQSTCVYCSIELCSNISPRIGGGGGEVQFLWNSICKIPGYSRDVFYVRPPRDQTIDWNFKTPWPSSYLWNFLSDFDDILYEIPSYSGCDFGGLEPCEEISSQIRLNFPIKKGSVLARWEYDRWIMNETQGTQ